jgi:FtsH-binding integral membrane protein
MVNTSLYNNLFTTSNRNAKGGSKKTPKKIINIFNEKKELLVATFANLIFQLGITYFTMEKTEVNDKNIESSRQKIFLYFLIQILIIIILAILPLTSIIKFLLFVIFSYTFGLELSVVKYYTSEDIIKFALLGTVSIFALMFAIGTFLIITGINLGFQFGLVLFYLLLILILLRLMEIFTNATSGFHKFLAIITILLFSVYIMFDTNVILQRHYYGDFITASMDYYLDILNIFINIISFNNN